MIQRYSRKEMVDLFSDAKRFEYMKRIEIEVAQAQAVLGIIPQIAAQGIAQAPPLSVDRIREIESVTRHDVIAFVQHMAESVGEHGRFVHFGLTSSDVLDTALNLQMVEAGQLLQASGHSLLNILKDKAHKHRSTLCTGRTHGMQAEPTTFGYKLLGHVAEFDRGLKRLHSSLEQLKIVKLSGAVGTYSSQSFEVESHVATKLGFEVETVATQVVPRDRLAELFSTFALFGSAIERLSVELRHLQRSEVGEIVEGFKKGQKGSSAMPHKKNPISAENLSGCARLLRSYIQPALENIVLWHERDISHSSVERVIVPDAFILLDYAFARMAELVDHLEVDESRMLQNIELSRGQLFSSHLLLALVEEGLTRDEAYIEVQRLSHQFPNEHLKISFLSSSPQRDKIPTEKLNRIFSGEIHRQAIEKAFDRAWVRLQ